MFALRQAYIPANDSRMVYTGRHVLQNGTAYFDWISSGIGLCFKTHDDEVRIVADIIPGNNRFGIFIDQQKQVHDLFTSKDDRVLLNFTVPANASKFFLRKMSEDQTSVSKSNIVSLFGFEVYGAEVCHCKMPSSARLFSVFGDSDSAAYGVDGSSNDPLKCEINAKEYQNFAHGWVQGVSSILSADVHVQAVSGIGVVKNAVNGAACATVLTMPEILNRTLQSESLPTYRPQSSVAVPMVVVIYIGSNDWANLQPPSKEQFVSTYTAMVHGILRLYQDYIKPAVVHVCGTEQLPCGYIQNVSASMQHTYITTGDAGIPKAGCLGHRNQAQQQSLALRLAPVIADAAGWQH